MKKFAFNLVGVISIVSLLFLTAGVVFLPAQAKNDNSGRKIVVFQDGLSEAEKDAVLNSAGASRIKNLDLVGASVANVSLKALEKLSSNPSVVRVEDDVVVDVQAQTLPWGINKIDAELVWPSGNTANHIKVAVIDTGISKSHPDLVGNLKGGINTINAVVSYDDGNGHGSHVAGTIAAVNNTFGVVGAGPNIDLYAVKALSNSGSGYLSDIIEGIQWSINNKMQVINMSLGTSSNILSFQNAVKAAKNAGIVVVAAAGNSGGSVLYPAAYPEAIAVSAISSNNVIASFSSRGSQVDLAAPGVSIYSTYKNTGYATLSGTSMAAPHVAGAAALVLNTPVGSYDTNLNGKWDPSEVQKKLQDKATDLGTVGVDNLYGWGLVNAYNAVQ